VCGDARIRSYLSIVGVREIRGLLFSHELHELSSSVLHAAFGEFSQNQLDRDAGSSNDRLAEHHRRIDFDAVTCHPLIPILSNLNLPWFECIPESGTVGIADNL
jgi:hypothetical protein